MDPAAPLSSACREVLTRPLPNSPDGKTYAEAIAQMLAEKALAGDIRAAQELANTYTHMASVDDEWTAEQLGEIWDVVG